jgi:hypothetical protein
MVAQLVNVTLVASASSSFPVETFMPEASA